MHKSQNRERNVFMKKIISIVLTLTMVFSVTAIGFAGSDEVCSCGTTPVIYVPGFGEAIYMNPESEDRVSVFPPEGDVIINCIPDMIKGIIALLITHNNDKFGDAAIDIINAMFGDASCNFDGTPMYENTGIEPYDMPTDAEQHKITNYEFRGSSDEETGEYTFYYDSRLDPFFNAEKLHEYVECVKELTGHETVSFACHSQGSTVLSTYLYVYGSAGIDKLMFLSPAFQGLSIMGSLFAHEFSLENKSEEFELFLGGILGDDAGSKILKALISLLVKGGAVDALLGIAENAFIDQIDKITEKSLAPTIGTMPGIWTFVPAEYYETAKEAMFGGDKRYAPLIEKLDNYHYSIKTNLTDILKEAEENGCSIIISVGYGYGSAPITADAIAHSDSLIDTKYTSIGATCAPYGSTLGEDYIQAESACGHNHISADNAIDASTCTFPEYTWFIKNQDHNNYNGDMLEFLSWAITYDGQPTVHTNELYPQFLDLSEDETLSPVKN